VEKATIAAVARMNWTLRFSMEFLLDGWLGRPPGAGR
jgi:hypothetical protein